MPPRSTRKTANSTAGPKVGDIVLVNQPRKWNTDGREPALVLKTGCVYNNEESDSEATKLQDGFLVKFQVSNTRVVVPASSVYQLEEEDKDDSKKSRWTSRASRSQRLQSSPRTMTQEFSESNSQKLVTPSPSVGNATAATSSEDETDTISEEIVEDKPMPNPKKRGRALGAKVKAGPAKKKRAASLSKKAAKSAKTAKSITNEDEASSENEGTVSGGIESPHFAKKNKKADAAASKKTAGASITASTKEAAPAKKKKTAGKKKSNKEVIAIHRDDDDDNNDDDGDDDDDDKPYKAEYSTTGRATCRRCDSLITKGTLRVSHVPLFRGKPGFRVYRHLPCIVFSEQVQSVEDIAGWKKIKRQSQEDYDLLCARVEDSKVELQKEQEELQPDELIQVTFQGETRSPPPGLAATLLPFQTEGVSWMYHQETKVEGLRGGILADEMGMGKALQTITTILDNRAALQHSKPGAKHPPNITEAELGSRVRESKLWDESVEEWKHEMKMTNVSHKIWPKKNQAARAGTLVCCPVIAITQWKAELEKFTEPGTLTIAIYHGPNRAKEFPLQKLIKYDIVLTTYQVLEQDFRKMVSPNKVTCPNCGGKYKADKLRVHLKYFCGEGAQKTEAQARQQRTADRPNKRRAPGGDKGSKKGQLKTKEFPKKTTKSTSSTSKKAPPSKKRKNDIGRGRAKKAERSDSEPEDDAVEISPITGRPSRSAARNASQLMSASMKEWTASEYKTVDDSSFGEESDDVGDDDEDESVMSYDDEDLEGKAIQLKISKKKPAKKKFAKKSNNDSDLDDSDSDSSEDAAAFARARKRQSAALRHLKTGSSGKKKTIVKGKGDKKKFDDDLSSEDESSDDERDPLEGVDLDELMKEAMEGFQMSLLHSVCWWRIVLDEAHMIKSRSSQTAAAAFSLVGVNRWALSGTPLQNRVGELYSLIRFLRVEPMAHYFCKSKGCACKSIHYRIKNGVCQDCNHSSIQHFSHFNKHVLNPIQRDGYAGEGRLAMFKLKNEVLDRCLLRRTKETRAEDMNLPPRIVSIRTIQLHPIEKDFYDALYTQTKSSFSDYVAQGTLLNNYAHIFDLLTRMRQAVDHPYLIVYSARNMERTGSTAGEQQVANGTTDCDICHEPPTGRVVSSCCGSAFCRSCVMEYLTVDTAGEGGTPCPSCRSPFSIDLNQADAVAVDDGALDVSSSGRRSSSSPSNARDVSADVGPSLKELPHVNSGSILRRINLAEFATSTKIEALVQELIQMRKTNPGSKALVFSQFVNMLDLIRWRLHCDPCLLEMGLGVRILHGSMDRKSRDAALKDFREDKRVRVLLMSLKSGGVALNLTVASHVFLVDNWWNPAAEMQAIDRTHRLGQHRCIRAVRFIAEGTVEERVLQLQEKKRLVFDGTVGRDAGSLKMLTEDDMASLFT